MKLKRSTSVVIPGCLFDPGFFRVMGLFEMSDLDKLEETGVCMKCDLSVAKLGAQIFLWQL